MSIWLDIKSFRWENKNSNENISKEEVLAKYFSQVGNRQLLNQNYKSFFIILQLSDIDIQRLYKIYENDFKLFGYSFRIRNMKFNC